MHEVVDSLVRGFGHLEDRPKKIFKVNLCAECRISFSSNVLPRLSEPVLSCALVELMASWKGPNFRYRKFFGDFKGIYDVWEKFDILPSRITENQLLFALYDYRYSSGEGMAHVLYLDNGKLIQVHETHLEDECLYGLWNPTDIPLESLPESLLNAPFTKCNFKPSEHDPKYVMESIIALRRVCGVPDEGLP